MIRKYLLAGFFTLLPSVVTLWILRAIFDSLVNLFDGPTVWAAAQLGLKPPPYWELALVSAVSTLLLLLLVGALVGNFVGVQLLAWLDDLALHIPVVKGIYGATKQLMNAIQSGQGGSFKDVVMVEWPNAGSYTLGFVAQRNCTWVGRAQIGGISGDATWPGPSETPTLVAVYIPTAPNPTSGYVVMVDERKIRPMQVSPEEALTWAISGGVVAPLGKGVARSGLDK
jgi:uncharacterized membrane protein